MSRRLTAAAAVLSGLLSAPFVLAQPQPVESPIAPTEGAATAPAESQLPEIPETRVIGDRSAIGGQGSATTGATVIESATRTGVPLGQTGSSVSVITREQIEERRATTVQELLRGLPGVDVAQQGGPGRVTSVFIRGANSEHTKVLLDGIPMNDPISPGRAFDFSNLSVDNIERIEVIRGPQSVLYGSDAIGGVINIITRRGQGAMQRRLSAMGGSFGTGQATGNVSGGNDLFHYSVGGSYFNTNGISAADRRLPGNTESDGFRLGTVAGRTGWTPTDNFDVDFVFRYNNASVDIDNGGGPNQDDPNARNTTEQVFTRTQIRFLESNEIWEQKLSFSTADHRRKNINPVDFLRPLDSFFSNFQGNTRLLDWQNNFFLHETNTVTVGASYQEEGGDSAFTSTSAFGPFDSVSPPQALRDAAVYAQDQIRLFDNRSVTTLGIRQDNYSQAGTATTYRATSLYRLPVTETAIRGSIGTGFKAPTIFQLFDGFSGNPSLRPEESFGWDYGVEQPFWDGQVVLGATYFRNDFTNLIDFNPATFAFFNVGAAASMGVELSAVFQWDDVTTITTTFTHLDTVDKATGLKLLRRPNDRANVGLTRRVLDDRATLNVNANIVGPRDDNDFSTFPATRVVLDPYIVLNATGTFDLTKRSQVYVRVDNLFDERYQEVFGFGTPGLSAYGGLAVNW
jgi:vitamin B12 transporter